MALTFYGISFNITGFGLNIYLTQFTYALVELPSKASIYYLLDKIGRRHTVVGSILLAGVCLGINTLVPKGTVKLFHFQRLTHRPEVILLLVLLFCKNKSLQLQDPLLLLLIK